MTNLTADDDDGFGDDDDDDKEKNKCSNLSQCLWTWLLNTEIWRHTLPGCLFFFIRLNSSEYVFV